MGNSHNTTPAKCIDCGRIRPRNQMHAGPRCHNCYIKADPIRLAKHRARCAKWAREHKAKRTSPLPVQDGGMVFADYPINIDDPYLREYIEKARRP